MKFLRLAPLLLAMALNAFASTSTARAAVLTDLPYRAGPDAPARCTLDLHLPDNPARAPLLVWFHGGSLIEGHKADPFNLKVAEGFRAQGLAVAMVNYRQSPGVSFPLYVEDAAAAIAWALRHAADHGLDPARIYVGGHSAGGYLALMATLDPAYLRATDTPPSTLRGIISLSAQTLTHGTVLKERAATARPIQVDSAAPLFFAHHTVPPVLLLCAERDVPARIEENQLLAALLRRNPANSVAYQTIPDRDHMSILERAANPADPVVLAINAFLAR
jgi:acetyl esterase/lipase